MNRSAWARLRLELRVVGIAAPATALAPPLAGAVLVTALYATGATAAELGRASAAVLAALAPLGAAIAASSIVGRDPGAELVMTITAYRRVVFLRAGLMVAAAALATLLDAVAFHAMHAWPPAQGTGGYVLIWVPPMVWLVALAVLIAVALRSSAAASGLIAGLWLTQLLMAQDFQTNTVLQAQYLFMGVADRVSAHEWNVNRIALPAVGVTAAVAASLLLGRPERFLGSDAA